MAEEIKKPMEEQSEEVSNVRNAAEESTKPTVEEIAVSIQSVYNRRVRRLAKKRGLEPEIVAEMLYKKKR